MTQPLSNKQYCVNYATAAYDETQLYLKNYQGVNLSQDNQTNMNNYRPSASSNSASIFNKLSPNVLRQSYWARQNSLKMYEVFGKMKDNQEDWLKRNLRMMAHLQITIDTTRMKRSLHYSLVALGILSGSLAYMAGRVFQIPSLTQLGLFTIPYALIGSVIAFAMHRGDEAEIRRNYEMIGAHTDQTQGFAYGVLCFNLPRYDEELNFVPKQRVKPQPQHQNSSSSTRYSPPPPPTVILSDAKSSGTNSLPPLEVDSRGIPLPIPATTLYQGISVPRPSAPY